MERKKTPPVMDVIGKAGKPGRRWLNYSRRCKRCGKIYRTTAKFGTICEGCRKPEGYPKSKRIEKYIYEQNKDKNVGEKKDGI